MSHTFYWLVNLVKPGLFDYMGPNMVQYELERRQKSRVQPYEVHERRKMGRLVRKEREKSVASRPSLSSSWCFVNCVCLCVFVCVCLRPLGRKCSDCPCSLSAILGAIKSLWHTLTNKHTFTSTSGAHMVARVTNIRLIVRNTWTQDASFSVHNPP